MTRRGCCRLVVALACALPGTGCGAEDPFGLETDPDSTSPPPVAAERVAATDTLAASPDSLAAPPDPPSTPEATAAVADDLEEPPSVVLRGPTSVTTRCGSIPPLIVIDGVVQPHGTSLSAIGHLDVDHVEIVKGRDATGIYGPNAANGAIKIQTKRGGQAAVLDALKPR